MKQETRQLKSYTDRCPIGGALLKFGTQLFSRSRNEVGQSRLFYPVVKKKGTDTEKHGRTRKKPRVQERRRQRDADFLTQESRILGKNSTDPNAFWRSLLLEWEACGSCKGKRCGKALKDSGNKQYFWCKFSTFSSLWYFWMQLKLRKNILKGNYVTV